MPAPEPLLRVLARMRTEVLADETLVRAVLSGRRKGQPRPRVGDREVRRVELRWVDLKAGRALQVVSYDEAQAITTNHPAGEAARDAVDDLVDEPFGNWHVETSTSVHQVRVTKRLEAVLHTQDRAAEVEPDRAHDQEKPRLLAEDDPVLRELGLSGADGRVKPSRQAKYRQVEEFLRLLDATVGEALDKGHLRRPTVEEPLRLTDLGCGNAYLTFAAHRYLSAVRGLPVAVTGVDVRQQSHDHNSELAGVLGADARFVVGTIAEAVVEPAPDVVLALHACDTATDEALARAVGWGAAVVLAAPCCHHDVAAQLRAAPTPTPYAALTRHGILRERFADTLTDALRALLLRLQGYRVDVVEFVGAEHTPRNTMLRAVLTGSPVRGGGVRKEYDALVAEWSLVPRLAVLLGETTATLPDGDEQLEG